jgi:hypothetical protein
MEQTEIIIAVSLLDTACPMSFVLPFRESHRLTEKEKDFFGSLEMIFYGSFDVPYFGNGDIFLDFQPYLVGDDRISLFVFWLEQRKKYESTSSYILDSSPP